MDSKTPEENVFYKSNVKSHEVDIQGIVNNSVYLNYLEDTRHGFLKSKGINFAEMHSEGKDLVIVRHEIDYLYPLKIDDEFYVTCKFSQASKLKFLFEQNIYREDGKHTLKAMSYGTCLISGKPSNCEELNKINQ